MNVLTSFIDASQIYGIENSLKLRSLDGKSLENVISNLKVSIFVP